MKIRIGNDFKTKWSIMWNGESEDFSDVEDISLSFNIYDKKIELIKDINYTITDNIIEIDCTPDICSILGVYNLELHYTKPSSDFIDGERRSAVDKDAFRIVAKSDKADSTQDVAVISDAVAIFLDIAYKKLEEIEANEDVRIANEGERIENEDERVENEGIRISNEQDRQINTATAIGNVEEATSNANNSAAYANEQGAYAEEMSSHPPTIINDYWHIWNFTTNQYETTGQYARGDSAIDGALVVQEKGQSAVNTMSQKAVTDELVQLAGDKVDKSVVKQTTGVSTTDVMSQKAVTDELTGVKNRFTSGQKPGISLPNSIMSDKIPMSFGNVPNVGDIDLPDELTNMGITRAVYRTKGSNNIEFGPAIYSPFLPPQGSYLWKSYFLYCSHPIASIPSTRHRILIIYTDGPIEAINGDVAIHKIRDGFFQVAGKHLIPTNDKTISSIRLECVFETDDSIPSGSICAVAGIDVQYSASDNFVPRDGIVYSKIKELETEIDEVANKDKISIISDVADGALEDPTLRNYRAPHIIINQTDPILNGFGLYKYQYANKSTNVEVGYRFYPGDGLTNEITNKFIAYNGKYCKIRYYVYTKSGVFPVTQTAGRLGITCSTSAGAFYLIGSNSVLNGGYEITKITDEVYRLDKIFKIEFTGTINLILAATVWEASIIPVDYVNGDFGVTGLSMKFGETAEELNSYKVIGDWEKQITPAEVSDIVDDKLELIQIPEVYNNIHFNLSKISPFLIKHQMREVDEFNQLSITMVGDSIFGRVDKASFTPETAEISLTPDTNGGVGNGYVTGHFPPNMWEQVVGYKVLQDLQFPHADVKYYNHVASEIVKTGTWVDRFPLGADCLRTATMESLNANAVLTFGGASFVKFVYSCYGFNSATRKIKVTFSDDNGVTWKTPLDLGLTESIASDAEGSGIYYIPAAQHKWGNFIWGGLNKTTNYKIKVEKIDSVETVNVWGFETWNNPRVNVIITAEGGNTAASQIARWERFYSKLYNPSLIIYELPYLNDLGTGKIKKFKGNITSLSSNPGTPVLNDFWHSNVAGTLTNFGGLTVLIGDYIEWNGTSWVHGSTELKTRLNEYKENNETVFKRLATLGCPVLTLITHNSNGWVTSRPFAPKEGLTILRNLVSKYGFASIDLNYYQMNFGYATGMYSDGTHLNDTGVELYRLLITKLLKINSDKRFVGSSEGVVYKKRIGSGSGAGTIAFGFEFSTTPTVRIYGNSEIAISSITQSRFTVTGSGAFDWEAYIN